jgi:hypothetical protein
MAHECLKEQGLTNKCPIMVSRIRIQDRTGLFEDCPVGIPQTPRKYIVLKRGIEDVYVW